MKTNRPLRVGDRVKVEHGVGVITGKDLPESNYWRWIVRIDEPAGGHRAMVSLAQNNGHGLCYFPKDVHAAIDTAEALS